MNSYFSENVVKRLGFYYAGPNKYGGKRGSFGSLAMSLRLLNAPGR